MIIGLLSDQRHNSQEDCVIATIDSELEEQMNDGVPGRDVDLIYQFTVRKVVFKNEKERLN